MADYREQTPKRHKAIQAIGAAILVGSPLVAGVANYATQTTGQEITRMGIAGAVAGLVVLGVGLGMAWWNHG